MYIYIHTVLLYVAASMKSSWAMICSSVCHIELEICSQEREQHTEELGPTWLDWVHRSAPPLGYPN